ncbi:hypothetical protein ABE10_01710 [Bacillus toyonensis]|nr:hypothetical protein [Bacillus toyonensis]
MSSDRIDHAAEALISVRAAHRAETKGEAQLFMTQAGVHATLALVEQQRIANLIALWSMPNESKPGFIQASGLTGDQDEQAARMIREGLGL